MDNQLEILDNDEEIIDLIAENNKQTKTNVLSILDKELPAGILFFSLDYNNSKRACLLCKFAKKGDSGLAMYISEDETANCLLPYIRYMLMQFNIKMSLEEFIDKYTYRKNPFSLN